MRISFFRTLSILILLVGSITQGYTQYYNFRSYTVEEGLTQSQVSALIQDKKGDLWIGTKGAGLSKFDGITFTNYSTVNGLIDNNVNQIVQDKDGKLWMATDMGVSCFDGVLFRNYNTRNGLLDKKINSLCVDSIGNIWVGTNKGLNLLKADQKKENSPRFLSFTRKDGLQSDTVETIYESRYTKIWLGTAKGVSRVSFNREQFNIKFSNVSIVNELKNKLVLSIAKDNNGYMWFGTSSGIFKLVTKSDSVFKFIKYSTEDGLIGSYISSIAPDSKGNIWLGTSNGATRIIFENNLSELEVKNYNRQSGLTEGTINVCIEDREGNIWFGTDNGLCRYSGSRFVVFNEQHGVLTNTVWSVLGDNNGDLWLGTEKGVTRMKFKSMDDDHPEIINYKDKDGFSSDVFYHSILQDRNNNIWFGTADGVLKLEYRSGSKSFSYPKKYNGKNDIGNSVLVKFMLEDSRSNIWFATNDGLIKFDGDKFVKFGLNDGLPDMNVNTLHEDHKGKLWVGTKSGLASLEGSKLVKESSFSGFKLDVSSIVEDEFGHLWLGSNSGEGITRYDGESFLNISESDGLGSNIVYLLIPDNSGFLWIGTNKGIDRLDLPEFYKSGKKIFKHYSKDEGFIGIECNSNAVYKDFSGNIWFGTIKGVIKYNMKEDVVNEMPPLTHITKVKLIDEDEDQSSPTLDYLSNSGLDELKNYYSETNAVTGLPQNLVLPYNKNSVTFDFLGICLTNPEKVRYRFMLKGLNDKWSMISKEHQASYYNLDPGEYTFLVQACNNNGLWNYDPVPFTFLISPPFWRTLWFYALVVLGTVGSMWLFIWYRTSQLRKSKKILEDKIAVRTKELQEKNTELDKLSIVARETVNAVAIANPSAEIEWVNEGFTRLTGYTLKQLLEEKGGSIYNISHNNNLKKIILESISTRQSKFYESLNVTKEGKEVWIHTTLTPIFNENGRVKKLVFIDTDISEMKKAEELIVQKNKDIIDSINYAKLIQTAILPSREEVKQLLPSSFILFKPREVVSGDFYWFHKHGDVIYAAACDCTGHGVPGAFMSMIGTMLLNEIVTQKQVHETPQILNKLNEEIRAVLKQDKVGAESKDGMDIALCALNTKTLELNYSGAMRPLYIIRKASDGEVGMLETEYILNEIKPDKRSIGGGIIEGDTFKGFTNKNIQLQKGDAVYMFTDGYPDQFGGPKGKKITNRHFKQMLLSVQFMSITRQEKMLDQDLQKWMGSHEQVDDVLVIGIKV